MIKKLLYAFTLFLGQNVMAQITTLPTSWDCNSATPPNGWAISTGVTQYASSGVNGTAALKFAGTGQNLTVHFSDNPGKMRYFIKANVGSGASYTGTFDVQESLDGTTWTLLKSHIAANTSTTAYGADSVTFTQTSRYARFFFTNKLGGNIGIDNVNLTIAGPTSAQEINVTQSAAGVINNTNAYFGSNVSTAFPIAFTVQNVGLSNALNVDSVVLQGSPDFTLGAIPTSIAAGASSNVNLVYNPAAAGTSAAQLKIYNNDSDEGVYTINLIGYGNNTATEPTSQAASISVSNPSTFKYTVNFTGAIQNVDGYVVVRSIGSAVNSSPVDGVVYKRGDAIGNSKVVYIGNNPQSFIPTFVVANTTYHFSVFAYNGVQNFVNYNSNNPTNTSVTTPNTMMPANYYNGISTSSNTFLADLKTLINPHSSFFYSDYDDYMVNFFESRDTTNDQRVITCIYSGENKVYQVPFDWTGDNFSREHTFCHSWMPTFPADAGGVEKPEYNDWHHLFPANFTDVNEVRSNYPLGIVSNVTSTFLQSKFGTDTNGKLTFEPRDGHKGDAARALFYMCATYNTVSGNTWKLPPNSAVNNIIQNQAILKQWSNDDPPSSWEIARNDFIDSLQHNRNPFIDHPEYVCFIDFANMAYIPNPSTPCYNDVAAICPTPTQQSVDSITNTSAKINWTIVTGANNYTVQYKLSTSATWTTASSTLNANSFVITGLTPNSNYKFQVLSNCTIGQSSSPTSNNAFTTTNVGIQELTSASVSITPNPSNGNFKVITNIKTGTTLNVSIIDIAGRTCFTESKNISSSSFEVNTNGLKAGVYTLRLSNKNGVANHKIVIE